MLINKWITIVSLKVFHCVHFECPATNDALEGAASTDDPFSRGQQCPMMDVEAKEEQGIQCPCQDSNPASDTGTASRSQPSGGAHFLPVENPQANHEDGYGMENMNLGGGEEEGAAGGAMAGVISSSASDRSVSPALTS